MKSKLAGVIIVLLLTLGGAWLGWQAREPERIRIDAAPTVPPGFAAWKPVRFGPPRKGFTMAVTFPYTATGAGTSAANGEYGYVGLDGDGVAYGYNGIYYARFRTYWVVADGMDSEASNVYINTAATDNTTFPLTGWESSTEQPGLASGDSPAPSWTGAATATPGNGSLLMRYKAQGH